MGDTESLRIELLKHFFDRGYSLKEAMHPQRLGNKPLILAKICRRAGIYFRDLDEVEKEALADRKARTGR